MMGHKEKLKGGTEYDAFSKSWRRFVVWNHGRLKKVKKAFRRRTRRKNRESIRREQFP